jgi:cytochrome oxidase Cu insertion factor (SCO1/SenC/PrrC family)
MRIRHILSGLLLSLALLLTACGGTVSTPKADQGSDLGMMDEASPTPEIMMHDTATPEAMMGHDTPTPDAMMSHETPTAGAMMEEGSMADSSAWFAASLTDVHTGQAFSINDLNGKVVLVETMAVWCSNCFKQQQQVKALHDQLGQREDFVSIGLDIDPNEDAPQLKSYVEQNGFDWLYAVAPADVARQIGLSYGDQFLNPPSTPILIVDSHGEAHPLPFGIKNADALMQAVEPYLNGSM